MTEIQALQGARALFETETPLKFDCGTLCGHACCKGDEEEMTGMLLFPGEEKLYIGQETWMEILDAELDFEGQPVKLLVCHMNCPRNMRPLSCRIFPLFPYVRDGQIKAEMDVRARPLCPLCAHGERGLSKEFVQAVQQAGELLLQNERQGEFLRMLTAHIDSYLFL